MPPQNVHIVFSSNEDASSEKSDSLRYSHMIDETIIIPAVASDVDSKYGKDSEFVQLEDRETHLPVLPPQQHRTYIPPSTVYTEPESGGMMYPPVLRDPRSGRNI
jgi:hypothetical protein